LSSRRGRAALRENPPPARRVVRYCGVCGAVWATIFSGLAAKENLTISLGYRPVTISDLKLSKLNKHGAPPRRVLPETAGLWALWRAGRRGGVRLDDHEALALVPPSQLADRL
jgi:hypothetical protein